MNRKLELTFQVEIFSHVESAIVTMKATMKPLREWQQLSTDYRQKFFRKIQNNKQSESVKRV
jgi:hypothetical protein